MSLYLFINIYGIYITTQEAGLKGEIYLNKGKIKR